MPSLKLDILVSPTYSKLTLGIIDTSIYPNNPPIVTAPTLTITVPNFGDVIVPFNIQDFNIYTSTNLEITSLLDDVAPLPDGVYNIRFSIAPAVDNFIEKSFMRTEAIQEKFDKAFMTLDMMECDRAIKTQQKVALNSIYFFIQGAIASGNECATAQANKLYQQADMMLNNFINNDCNCSGTNY